MLDLIQYCLGCGHETLGFALWWFRYAAGVADVHSELREFLAHLSVLREGGHELNRLREQDHKIVSSTEGVAVVSE